MPTTIAALLLAVAAASTSIAAGRGAGAQRPAAPRLLAACHVPGARAAAQARPSHNLASP